MILFALEVLMRAGVIENSKKWSDYEKAKQFLIKNYSTSPEEYKAVLKTISDLIGV